MDGGRPASGRGPWDPGVEGRVGPRAGGAPRPPAAGRGGRVKSELWGLVRVAWGLGAGGLGAEEGPLGALTEESPCFCFSSTRQHVCVVVLRSALSLQRERGRAGLLSGLAREAAVEPSRPAEKGLPLWDSGSSLRVSRDMAQGGLPCARGSLVSVRSTT